MATAKKAQPAADAPQIDEAALVPERPASKVEAGLKAAESKPADEPSASEAGQAMLAEDIAAMDDLVNERVLDILVGLGVPEEIAKTAVAGDMAGAAEAAEKLRGGADVKAASDGDICRECYAEGWDTPAIAGFTGVGCVHGSWQR